MVGCYLLSATVLGASIDKVSGEEYATVRIAQQGNRRLFCYPIEQDDEMLS